MVENDLASFQNKQHDNFCVFYIFPSKYIDIYVKEALKSLIV